MKHLYLKILRQLICLFLPIALYAQQPKLVFGEIPKQQASDEITDEQRKNIIKNLQKNVADLKAKGKLPQQVVAGVQDVKFIWPIRQAAGSNDPGFYGISNYIDQDLNYPNQVLDYNCGNRTYDLSSGYNHRGTDIFTWPYPWMKMDANAVEVIAAADGVIIGKYDGNADTSCAFCVTACDWNAVYVQNTDGTICWYGHLKKNSLTSKAVGAAVTAGEYLGVVGSAGNSTGPHLHFEVWKDNNYNFLIDPWEGACNSDGNLSYWVEQQPYRVPMINKVASSGRPPAPFSCYNSGTGEKPYYKDTFYLGTVDSVIMTAYLRDIIPNTPVRIVVTRPDNSVFDDRSFTVSYSGNLAYYYWYWYVSSLNQTGTWKFTYYYGNNSASDEFVILNTLPLNLLSFTGTTSKSAAQLNWKTTSEQNISHFVIEKSNDGNNYKPIGFKTATGSNNVAENDYNFIDATPYNGVNYYRLRMFDNDGTSTLSKVINLKMQVTGHKLIVLLTNPANDIIQFVAAKDLNNANIKIADARGRIIKAFNKQLQMNQQSQVNIQDLSPGTYYLIIESKSEHISIPFLKQ